MKFFGSKNAPVQDAHSTVVDVGQEVVLTGFDRFLDVVAPDVSAYRQAYIEVGRTALDISQNESLRAEGLKGALEFKELKEMEYDRRGNSIGSRAADPQQVVDRYFELLPGFFIAHVKHASSASNVREVIRRGRQFTTGYDLADAIGQRITPHLFNPTKHCHNSFYLAYEMEHSVAAKFSGMASEDVDVALSHAAPTIESSGSEDIYASRRETYRDVRDIFAADLMSGDRSRLRAFLEGIKENPDSFLQSYILHSESLGEDSPLSRAISAVIIAADMDGKAITYSQAATTLRPRWGEIDRAINREFDSYVRTQSALVEKSVVSISGLPSLNSTRRGIRFPITEDDYQKVRSLYANIIHSDSSAMRSQLARFENVQSAGEINDEMEAGGREMAAVSLFKNGINGEGHQEACNDDTLDDFIREYAGNDDELFEDVLSMIDSLRANPVGGATNPTSRKVEVTIGGRRLHLREYSPTRDSLSLKSGKAGNRTRITYYFAAAKNGNGKPQIIIDSILRHDNFDKRLGKKA